MIFRSWFSRVLFDIIIFNFRYVAKQISEFSLEFRCFSRWRRSYMKDLRLRNVSWRIHRWRISLWRDESFFLKDWARLIFHHKGRLNINTHGYLPLSKLLNLWSILSSGELNFMIYQIFGFRTLFVFQLLLLKGLGLLGFWQLNLILYFWFYLRNLF